MPAASRGKRRVYICDCMLSFLFFRRRRFAFPLSSIPGPKMAAIGLEQEGPGEGASAIVHKQVRGHDCMLASIRVRACVAVGASRLS